LLIDAVLATYATKSLHGFDFFTEPGSEPGSSSPGISDDCATWKARQTMSESLGNVVLYMEQARGGAGAWQRD